MKRRRSLKPSLQLTLSACLGFPCCVIAADLTGLWEGEFACSGDAYNWQVTLQHGSGNRMEGEVLFQRASDGARGQHRITGQYYENTSLLRLNGAGWIERVQRRAQFGFQGNHNGTATAIDGQLRDRNCGTFHLERVSSVAEFTGVTAPGASAPVAQTRTTATRGGREQNTGQTTETAVRGGGTGRQPQEPAENEVSQARGGGRTTTVTRANTVGQVAIGTAGSISCEGFNDWVGQLATAWPGSDFNQFRSNRLSWLFLDEQFQPVFGRSYGDSRVEDWRATWRENSLGDCLGAADENVGLRQNLERAFILANGTGSFNEMQAFSGDIIARRAAVDAILDQLPGAGSEQQVQLADAVSIQMVGLPFPDKARYRDIVAGIFPERQDGPALPGVAILDHRKAPVEERRIMEGGARSLERDIARMSLCDMAGAGAYKTAYLGHVRRLYGNRRTEAEELLDRGMEDHLDDKPRCTDENLWNLDNDMRYSLDQIMNFTRGGEPVPGTIVPRGFLVRTTRPDDPDVDVPIRGDQFVIGRDYLLNQARQLGTSATFAASCDSSVSRDYRTDFTQAVLRFHPDLGPTVEQFYDLGAQRAQQSIDTGNDRLCDAFMVDGYLGGIEQIMAPLDGSEVVTRAEYAARVEAELDKAGPGVFDPDLYRSIRGEHDEINTLGSRLEALQAGTIWWNKYLAKYAATRGPEFDFNTSYFIQRRIADFLSVQAELERTIISMTTIEEVDRFLATHMGVSADYRDASSGRFFPLANTQKIIIDKQQEYKALVAQYGKRPKQLGIFGPLELLEALTNSQMEYMTFQRRFTGHSLGTMNPISLWDTFMVVSYYDPVVNSCEQVEVNHLRCSYQARTEGHIAGMVAESQQGMGQANLPDLLRTMFSNLAQVDGGRADFVRTSSGWISPDIIQDRMGEVDSDASIEAFKKMYEDAAQNLVD